ncbi:hypothetical protein C5167_021612 [Papaver somniferum]|nr:hypothetical protein C5167_021612 [Papaver somniferum]
MKQTPSNINGQLYKVNILFPAKGATVLHLQLRFCGGLRGLLSLIHKKSIIGPNTENESCALQPNRNCKKACPNNG